jgi:hypothetical protein
VFSNPSSTKKKKKKVFVNITSEQRKQNEILIWILKYFRGWVWWYTPVIPATWKWK